MRIQTIINTQAGTAARLSVKDLRRQLAAVWAECGHDARVIAVDGRGMAAAIDAACADPLVDAVVIGGGDGSVSRALEAVVASGKMLGILPLGTMNYVARELAIPLDPVRAVAALAQGRSTRIDLGRVNGRSFMIRACLGMLPEFIRGRDKVRRKKKSSFLDAVVAGVMEVARSYPLISMELTGDGIHRRVVTPFVMVSNNLCRDSDPMMLRRERLDGGVLGLYVGRGIDPFSLADLGAQAVLGQWSGNSQLEVRALRWLEIQTPEGPVTVSVDGEIEQMVSPLRFHIVPAALEVLVPA